MLPVLSDTMMPVPTKRFDSLFDRIFLDGDSPGRAWSPVPMGMWEDDDFIHIEADLPGVSEEDVELFVHDGMFFIRGERKPEEGRKALYDGRTFGRFERAITLPEAVKVDDVQATLTHGILRVALPKSPDAKPRKIALKTG